MSNTSEILITFLRLARVDQFAVGKQDEFIEQGHDVAARLVDGEYDGTVVIPCERDETVYHAECIISI